MANTAVCYKKSKSFGEKSTTGIVNSTELGCNYTKVINLPQQGGMGITESPEYLIKSPTFCIHHSHPKVLRCCRYDHSPNYRVTGQDTGKKKLASDLQQINKQMWAIHFIPEPCFVMTETWDACCLRVIAAGWPPALRSCKTSFLGPWGFWQGIYEQLFNRHLSLLFPFVQTSFPQQKVWKGT